MKMSKALTVQQQDFIIRRVKMLKTWPIALTAVLLGFIGLCVYLYIRVPQMVDPMHVAEKIENKEFEVETLQTMALMLPVVFLILIAVMFALIIFVHIGMMKERKYLKIIDAMRDKD